MNVKLALTIFVACILASLIVSLLVKHKTYNVAGDTQTGLIKPSLSSSPAKPKTA